MKTLYNRFVSSRFVSTRSRGIAVIELVLILVILIALVIIFKDRLTTLLQTIFSKIETNASSIYS